MQERKFNLHDGKSGAAITVHVTSRSRQNEIREIQDDGTVSVHLAGSQSVEKANQALIAFLAQVLEIHPSQLEIVAGMQSSDKLITILDLDKSLVEDRIRKSIP